jgi:hypothetical protein
MVADTSHRTLSIPPDKKPRLAEFLEAGASHVATITWDASLHGRGMVLRWWDNREGVVIISTLPNS